MTCFARADRLIQSVIRDLDLDLRGIRVLTEAASGPYVVTPLIAALAQADRVVAVARDSVYGPAEKVLAYTEQWAERLGVRDRIELSCRPAREHADTTDLVTNLGSLRPMDDDFVARLPATAAIALMFETWEFRPSDLDRAACQARGIPVLGTRETHPRLQIFRYVGLLVLKLLLEAELELFRSRILLIGSGDFGRETAEALRANGAELLHLDPLERWAPQDEPVQRFLQEADAVVLVEHQADFYLLGGADGLPIDWLAPADATVIHLCGRVDDDALAARGVRKHPAGTVRPGFMAVATDYLGPRPVIDLHAGGLKVGEALVRGQRKTGTAQGAVDFALSHSPAMDWS